MSWNGQRVKQKWVISRLKKGIQNALRINLISMWLRYVNLHVFALVKIVAGRRRFPSKFKVPEQSLAYSGSSKICIVFSLRNFSSVQREQSGRWKTIPLHIFTTGYGIANGLMGAVIRFVIKNAIWHKTAFGYEIKKLKKNHESSIFMLVCRPVRSFWHSGVWKWVR